jgi:ribonuclease HIII
MLRQLRKMGKSPACFVTKVDLSLAEKLKHDLLEQGFTLSTPPYTLFSAQKEGISCSLYQSGKLVVQGKEKDEFITYYLEPEIMKELTYSYPEQNVDFTPHIGIDEAGKGDFFGPLCIAGLYANEAQIKKLLELGVRDSKRMSDQSVIKLSKILRAQFAYSIVRLSPHKYNELYEKFKNLNRLLAWGHATAISDLVTQTSCDNVLIDQFASEHLVINALKQKDVNVHLTQRVRAEEDLVVAAASIIARGVFLESLKMLSEEVGLTLPKGASSIVIKAGKMFIIKHGQDALNKVAKLHFKTTQQVIST